MSGILISPWVFQCIDVNDAAFTAVFSFDDATRALGSCTVVRDSGCLFTDLWLGLGLDRTPNSTLNTFHTTGPSHTINKAVFAARGLNVIEDVWALQITCG